MRLLLVEDDADLGQAVSGHLAAHGHVVQWCRNLATARAAPPPELALLDLQLPDGDGLALLQQWRTAGHGWPVVVVTARDQVSDRIRGLQAGADDYLVKPFDLDELAARVAAVARRTAGSHKVQAGRLLVDLGARAVHCDGQPRALTAMEWAVLACLARRPGRIYTRGEIEDRLAESGLADSSSNTLEVVVSRLRKKLGADSISTHRGLGYRLEG